MFGKLGIFRQDLRSCHIIVVVVERQLSTQKSVEDNSQAPNVDLFTSILLSLEHFRGRVAYCTAKSLEMVVPALVFSRKPEIYQLYVLVLIEEDILEFEIAMNARVHMDVGDGSY